MITITYSLDTGLFSEEQDQINIIYALNGNHFAIFRTHPAQMCSDIKNVDEFIMEFSRSDYDSSAAHFDGRDAEKFGLRILQPEPYAYGVFCRCGCKNDLFWIHCYIGWNYISTCCRTCLTEKYSLGEEINTISPTATVEFNDDNKRIKFIDTYSVQNFIKRLLNPEPCIEGPHILAATLFNCYSCKRLRPIADPQCEECQNTFGKISLIASVIAQYPLVGDVWVIILTIFVLPKEALDSGLRLDGFSSPEGIFDDC